MIDGYHSFMAIETPIPPAIAASAFFLGGGYKYAMAGEGMGFMHCPPGFGQRPPITGWFAEFGELDRAAGQQRRLYQRRDALHGRDLRSVGALPVQRHPADAGREWADDRRGLPRGSPGSRRNCSTGSPEARLGEAELLNPLDGGPHARFLAFRCPSAQRWCSELDGAGHASPTCAAMCLRIGFGLYHDEEDVDALAAGSAPARLGLQPVAQQAVGDARRPRRDLPCPTRRSAGRGRRSCP